MRDREEPMRASMELDSHSLSSSPRNIRQRNNVVDLNLIVAGHKGAGKSSLVRTLFETLPIKALKKVQPCSYKQDEMEMQLKKSLDVSSASSIMSSSYATEDINISEDISEMISYLPAENPSGIYVPNVRWVFNSTPTEKLSLMVVDTQGIPVPIGEYTKDRLNNIAAQSKGVLQKIMNFLESKFEITLLEESKVRRNPRGPDHKFHVCLYVLDPCVCLTNNGLTSIDIYALKKICAATNVVMCLGKADSISIMDLKKIRDKISHEIQANDIPIFPFDNDEDNDVQDLGSQSVQEEIPKSFSSAPVDGDLLSGNLSIPPDRLPKVNCAPPFTILNMEFREPDAVPSLDPTAEYNQTVMSQLSIPRVKYPDLRAQLLASFVSGTYKEVFQGRSASNFKSLSSPTSTSLDMKSEKHTNLNSHSNPPGRIYPWGVLYCDNPDHCDLLKMKQAIFLMHTSDLRLATKINCYEQWRTAKLLEIRNSLIKTSKSRLPIGSVDGTNEENPSSSPRSESTAYSISQQGKLQRTSNS